MQIIYIGNRLARWGYTPTSVETLGKRMEELVEIVPFSDKRNSFIRLWDMLKGIFLHRNSAQGVLIDTYSSTAFYFAFISGLLCRVLKIPYVPILHGGNLPHRLKKSPYLSRVFFNSAKSLVAPSRYLYQHFVSAGYHQTSIIPNYIDLENYPYKHRTNPAPKLLWVRSFHSTYNPNLAIDILVLVKEKYPSATLCMVGPDKDGSMGRFKHYAREKNILDDIQITGKLEKKAWIELSKEYDVFLNTTNFDNTPVSVMEAMALGMLVVSTNAGGVPAIIQDKEEGMIFPCGDAELGAKAVLTCLNQSLAEQLSFNARVRASTWDWQVVKLQWETLFNSLLPLQTT